MGGKDGTMSRLRLVTMLCLQVVVLGISLAVGWRLGQKAESRKCSQEHALSSARQLLDGAKLYGRILDYAQSNRIADVRRAIAGKLLLDLQMAWDISRMYPGELENDLDPLVADLYEPVRRE